MDVQLVSPLPDSGFAYNQGIYWPVGLLTIASVLRREIPGVEVEILDEAIVGEDGVACRLSAPIVGVQATSCMTYGNVLRVAQLAKAKGARVIVGGPFASEVPEQILRKRPFIDAVVVGAGEEPMIALVRALRAGPSRQIPSVIPAVWHRRGDEIVASPTPAAIFDYERTRPLDYSLLPVEPYHRNYRVRMKASFVGSFQIFTHFGCRYREIRRRTGKDWCTYCALAGGLSLRSPAAIVSEIREALTATQVPPGSRVMLKCYGDNASALGTHLTAVAEALERDPELQRYDLWWSMYGQSSLITPRLIEVLKRLRVFEVYVGFDSVDDQVQRLNDLGTTRATHTRAARLLREAGIRIHAGFVLGCRGETPDTIAATVDFARELCCLGNVDMFHASPLVVLPGSPAFRLLSERVPALKETDFLDTPSLQRAWITYFCPELGESAPALERLDSMAKLITNLGRIPSSFGGWRERALEREGLANSVELSRAS